MATACESQVEPKVEGVSDSTPGTPAPDVVTVAAKIIEGEDNEEWPIPVIDENVARKESPSDSDGQKYQLSKQTPTSTTVVTVGGLRPSKSRDPTVIERTNLLNLSKLVIKELLDSSLSHGRMLDDHHVPLQQFFLVLEHVLRHSIKPKKGILRDKREFWQVLEQVEKYMPEAIDITTSVREMTSLKTPLGKARAWIRLAVMQKKLADYFRLLVDKRDEILVSLYEPGAIMLEEEAVVIAGLLVGLNVIDCNIGIKDEDLDQPMGVIDFSLYMRDPNYGATTPDDERQKSDKMTTILDQKNYLEELNTHLKATVTNKQQTLETLQTANTLMKEDLAISKNSLVQLQEENTLLKAEKDLLLNQHHKQLQIAREDMDTERETYQTSRVGLDSKCVELDQRLQEETQMRMDVEKELELQIGMKQEMEVAVRLLEKDIHEKQDTCITLRKQLGDIKAINLDMYNKLQESDSSLKHKTELVSKLEEKTNQMACTIKEMENRLKQYYSDKMAAEETSRKLGQQLADKDIKRTALETDLKIEREWRGTLQKNLEQEKEKVAILQTEIQKQKEVKKEFDALQEKHQLLKVHCSEQETALADLGSHLSQSKLRVEDMREAQDVFKEAHWVDEAKVSACLQCRKTFSVSRRKHHCRSCGEVFCGECSDNKMPLPSSAKPERVCDNCHTMLLQRYSAK